MTTSLENLIDTCYNIKLFLKVSSYELHQYEDGSYADFKVRNIREPRTLLKAAGSHEVTLLSEDNNIVVRVFERI